MAEPVVIAIVPDLPPDMEVTTGCLRPICPLASTCPVASVDLPSPKSPNAPVASVALALNRPCHQGLGRFPNTFSASGKSYIGSGASPFQRAVVPPAFLATNQSTLARCTSECRPSHCLGRRCCLPYRCFARSCSFPPSSVSPQPCFSSCLRKLFSPYRTQDFTVPIGTLQASAISR